MDEWLCTYIGSVPLGDDELRWVSWDGSESGDENVTNILSEVLVVLGGGILGDVGSIGHDLTEVLGDVLDEGSDELLWVSELLGPGLNSLEVVLDTLAVVEVGWELLGNLDEELGTLDDVADVLLLDILDSGGDLGLEGIGISDAVIEVGEVVLLDELDHESVKELLKTLEVKGNFAGTGEDEKV